MSVPRVEPIAVWVDRPPHKERSSVDDDDDGEKKHAHTHIHSTFSLSSSLCAHREVVVGVFHGRVGVAAAPALVQKRLVLPLLGIRLRPCYVSLMYVCR